MENIYTSYTKEVQGETYYFVKKYLSFPEFHNVPDVLVGYGMHTDFDKACSIALVTDVNLQLKLMKHMLNTVTVEKAKVIEMLPVQGNAKSIIR